MTSRSCGSRKTTIQVFSAAPYQGEPLLVPQGANDEGHESALLEPSEGQLGAQREEVTHLVQVERTLTGHRDES